jgi:hypothetical protein
LLSVWLFRGNLLHVWRWGVRGRVGALLATMLAIFVPLLVPVPGPSKRESVLASLGAIISYLVAMRREHGG